MRRFSERDVRRHYDLLQHKPELGYTQLKAVDNGQIIGIGLFDNEADFVSECARYNSLGQLYAGVNPRAPELGDEFGGLVNRMRTLFTDIADSSHIKTITGIAAPDNTPFSAELQGYLPDASVLDDFEILFAMDSGVSMASETVEAFEALLTAWMCGGPTQPPYSVLQYVPIAGTARQNPTFFRPRRRFVKYRPFFLDGFADSLRAAVAPPGAEP